MARICYCYAKLRLGTVYFGPRNVGGDGVFYPRAKPGNIKFSFTPTFPDHSIHWQEVFFRCSRHVVCFLQIYFATFRHEFWGRLYICNQYGDAKSSHEQKWLLDIWAKQYRENDSKFLFSIDSGILGCGGAFGRLFPALCPKSGFLPSYASELRARRYPCIIPSCSKLEGVQCNL